MKDLKDLSPRHKINRFHKYLEKLNLPNVHKIRKAQVPAPHASMLMVKTKQTLVVLGVGDGKIEFTISYSLVHKDSLQNFENLITVMLESFDAVNPSKNIILASARFDMNDKSLPIQWFDNSGSDGFRGFLSYYVDLATRFFWDLDNSIKFFLEDSEA
jgi:hypothetical protein